MLRKVSGLSLLLFAAPTMAADISYNFIEVGYQEIDIDGGFLGGLDIDGDGYGIAGSFELNENWFVAASYAKAEFDFGVDLDQVALGAGYHVPISDNADFYGGKTRNQDPILSTEAHVRFLVSGEVWTSLDGNFWRGGRTRVDRVENDDLQSN